MKSILCINLDRIRAGFSDAKYLFVHAFHQLPFTCCQYPQIDCDSHKEFSNRSLSLLAGKTQAVGKVEENVYTC